MTGLESYPTKCLQQTGNQFPALSALHRRDPDNQQGHDWYGLAGTGELFDENVFGRPADIKEQAKIGSAAVDAALALHSRRVRNTISESTVPHRARLPCPR